VAIKAGVLLAERLFGGSAKKMDYHLVRPTYWLIEMFTKLMFFAS